MLIGLKAYLPVPITVINMVTEGTVEGTKDAGATGPAKDTSTFSPTMQCYLDAAAASSARGRKILAVMVAAVILAFVAHWNSKSEGWINSRVALLEDAYHLTAEERDSAKWLQQDSVVRASHPATSSFFPATPEGTQRKVNAREFLAFDNLTGDIKHIKDKLEILRAHQIGSTRVIHVPFLGFVFDINDLSMVAGLTFITLLFWFMFSMISEYKDLRLYFSRAKQEGCLVVAHELLSMRQVLTILVEENQGLVRFLSILLNILIKGLMLAPFILLAYIRQHDLSTFEIGMHLSPELTLLTLDISGMIWAILLVLTGASITISYLIDRRWNEWTVIMKAVRDPKVPGS